MSEHRPVEDFHTKSSKECRCTQNANPNQNANQTNEVSNVPDNEVVTVFPEYPEENAEPFKIVCQFSIAIVWDM